MTFDPTASIFLSHNSADKADVRRLAATVALTGVHVWFDEWVIRPGDSIPGSINTGLAGFTTFVLIWSENAAKSQWVKKEMEAAVTRWIRDDGLKLVPILLDRTPLPPILSSILYIDGTDGDYHRVTRELLGIQSDAAFRIAVQSFIFEAGLDFQEFPGVGVMVACPECGATPDNLQEWESIDWDRDDIYRGVRCNVCGWSEGSEV